MVCTCINGCQGNDLPNVYWLGIVFQVRIVYIYSYVSVAATGVGRVQSNLHSIYNSALTVISCVTESREVSLFPRDLGLQQRSLRVVNFSFRMRFFQFESFFVGSVIADLLKSK